MIVHLHGELVPADAARVSVFDRGFLFGDGVYEGLRAIPATGAIGGAAGARIIGLRRHQRRLADGLSAARIGWDAARLGALADALLAANGLRDAFVYWQVTRGTPPTGAPVRTRVPAPGTRPTVFGYCLPLPALPAPGDEPATKAAATHTDQRWLRGEIKSIALMGNILAAMAGGDAGADEAILIRETGGRRLVTEGTYTNVVVVSPGGEVATPDLRSAPLLPGVTRRILLDLDSSIRERAVTEAELHGASEVILLGTTTLVTSVTRLDGRAVGDGRPGPTARRLLGVLLRAVAEGREDVAGSGGESG